MILTLRQIKDGTGFATDARFEQVTDYNGWANRETWAVALYINNDQGWQESVLESIREGCDWKTCVAPNAHAGELVRENVAEAFDPDTHECIFTRDALLAMQDIGSLWRVNWDELGAAFLNDASEEDAPA